MIKYKITKWKDSIDKVEVQSETANSVKLEKFTERKHTTSHQYFDSWKEAHEQLIARQVQEIKTLEEKLNGLRLDLQHIKEQGE